MSSTTEVFCLCGHTIHMHLTGTNCFYNKQTPAGLQTCLCQQYKADNLSYLEALSEQSSRG